MSPTETTARTTWARKEAVDPGAVPKLGMATVDGMPAGAGAGAVDGGVGGVVTGAGQGLHGGAVVVVEGFFVVVVVAAFDDTVFAAGATVGSPDVGSPVVDVVASDDDMVVSVVDVVVSVVDVVVSVVDVVVVSFGCGHGGSVVAVVAVDDVDDEAAAAFGFVVVPARASGAAAVAVRATTGSTARTARRRLNTRVEPPTPAAFRIAPVSAQFGMLPVEGREWCIHGCFSRRPSVDKYIVRSAILAPAIKVVRAEARLRTETSWLDSWHCFSYGRHYEPDNTHHGLLVVCNDNRLLGSTGFGAHTHTEMEIVTWVVEGEIEHRDSTGAVHVLRPNVIGRLSAGIGIEHSEMNPAGWAPARAIEMWVPPDRERAVPSSQTADVGEALAGGGLVPVASGLGHEAAVSLNQRQAVLWAGRLAAGEAVLLPDAPHVHVFVACGGGVLDTGGLAGAGQLFEGDSVRLVAAGTPLFTAGRDGAELLVWETG
jgi:quercetin 2,3-dioxygenase